MYSLAWESYLMGNGKLPLSPSKVKWLAYEAEHSLLPSDKVIKAKSCTSAQYIFMAINYAHKQIYFVEL